MIRRLVFATSLMAIICSLHEADAQTIGIDAHASAGLDPATRDFIATLPAVWAPQLNMLFDGLMKRTDQSVSSYIQQVDQLIAKTMSDSECKIAATEKNVVDDIVQRFPWVNQAGSVQRVASEVDNSNKQRRLDSSPKTIMYLYDGHTQLVSVVACEPGQQSGALKNLKDILDDYNGRWLVWNRLDNIKCPSVKECLAAYKSVIEAEVHTSDPYLVRDVTDSKADDTFKAYVEPTMPTFPAWFPHFDEFETALGQLYAIENSIYASRARRVAKADEKWNESQQKYNEAIKLLNYETYIMSGSPGQPTDGDYGNAKKRVPVIKDGLDSALALAKDASDTDGKYIVQYNQIKTSTKDRIELDALRRKAFLCATPFADKANCA
jgi:hypothetical protein